MKKIPLPVLFLLLVLTAGCSTRYVDVRGEKFEMISESEEINENSILSRKPSTRVPLPHP